jgi:hypothetical protein
MPSYEKPNITRTNDGKFCCVYTGPDGSQTRLVADDYAQLCERLAESHQHAVGALTRAKANFERLKFQAQPTKDAEILEARRAKEVADSRLNVYHWAMRNPQFWPCDANNAILDGYIKANGLSFSVEDIDFAYSMVKNQLADRPGEKHATPGLTPPAIQQPPADPVPSREEIAAMSADEFKYALRRFGKENIERALNAKGEK